jgi:hypothetical protein
MAMKFRDELTYTEGLAVSATDPTTPVVHAWVVDRDGRVIDLAWTGERTAAPGLAYFGATIPYREFIGASVAGPGAILATVEMRRDDGDEPPPGLAGAV